MTDEICELKISALEEKKLRVSKAYNAMRLAAEKSSGDLAYHQNLQGEIEVIAQLVIKEITNLQSQISEIRAKEETKEKAEA